MVNNYCKKSIKKESYPDISDAHLHRFITTAIATGEPTLATLRSPTTPTAAAAVKIAHNFMLGWRAAEWRGPKRKRRYTIERERSMAH